MEVIEYEEHTTYVHGSYRVRGTHNVCAWKLQSTRKTQRMCMEVTEYEENTTYVHGSYRLRGKHNVCAWKLQSTGKTQRLSNIIYMVILSEIRQLKRRYTYISEKSTLIYRMCK
jgi:phage FluMu protein Com